MLLARWLSRRATGRLARALGEGPHLAEARRRADHAYRPPHRRGALCWCAVLFWLVVLIVVYQWLGFVLSQIPVHAAWGESLTGFLIGIVATWATKR